MFGMRLKAREVFYLYESMEGILRIEASGPNFDMTFVYAGHALAYKFKSVELYPNLGFASLHTRKREPSC